MPFVSALSKAPRTARAVEEACANVRSALTGPPDLACVFFSPHHLEAAAEISNRMQVLQARALIGCVGDGIICGEHELEQQPAVCVWAGKWNNAISITPYHIDLEKTTDGPTLLGWPDELTDVEPARSAMLTLGEPRTFPSDGFVQQMNEDYPGVRVLGGMASGAWDPGECRLFLNERIIHSGAVGVVLEGDFGLRTVVSQGCRPIGKHMVITRGHENVIQDLGGKPALVQLQQLWQELTPEERTLVEQGWHVGLVINEYQGDFHKGDFLVRNVIGLDRKTGAIGIADHVRVGQTIQFQVRDARTADDDLHQLLRHDRSQHAKVPAAALLFTCNGRGTRLFRAPDHDAHAVHSEMGDIPVAGFFAAGEIGPIGGKNFIHGFTASVAIFEE
jgi:small ligand-binding sensory domain FIST